MDYDNPFSMQIYAGTNDPAAITEWFFRINVINLN